MSDDNVVILPARVEVPRERSRGEILEQRVEALEVQVAELVRREQLRDAQSAEHLGQ